MANSENNPIWICWGSDSPAVWLSAISRLSATIRSMNLIFSGVSVMLPYR